VSWRAAGVAALRCRWALLVFEYTFDREKGQLRASQRSVGREVRMSAACRTLDASSERKGS